MSNYKWRFNLTIDDVKKELSNDEQMLASAFKAEKLYKKHKLKIFTVVGLTIAYFGGSAIMHKMDESKKEQANSAYLTLMKDSNNNKALKSLESNNPALFELYSYQKALKASDKATLQKLSSSNNELIADLSTYHLAVIEGKPAESKYNNEMARVHNASLLINEEKLTEAQEELELIPEDSPVYNISKMIKHYGVKG